MGDRGGYCSHDGASVESEEFFRGLRRVGERQIQTPDPTLCILRTGDKMLMYNTSICQCTIHNNN
jgi:hypothetical protein